MYYIWTDLILDAFFFLIPVLTALFIKMNAIQDVKQLISRKKIILTWNVL